MKILVFVDDPSLSATYSNSFKNVEDWFSCQSKLGLGIIPDKDDLGISPPDAVSKILSPSLEPPRSMRMLFGSSVRESWELGMVIRDLLITIWVNIIAKQNNKLPHVRDDSNETQEVQDPLLDLKGELRRSFFVLSANNKPETNTLCSPLSALLPLAKLALGAEGNSLDELLAAIGVSNKSKIKDFYKPLLTRLRYLPGVKLNIASRLFISDRVHLQHNFEEAAVEVFQSSIDKIDFTFPTNAAEEINSWIATQTNDIIKDMLEPSEINPLTSMILVNAIYFNGHWTEPFEKVSNVTFHYSTSSQKNIEMMMREGEFNYTKSEALASQIISIPYSGGSASLVVVCPEARHGLAALIALLHVTVDMLAEAMYAMSPTRVKLTMPKFKLHHELDLGRVYMKMGIKTIFDKAQSGLTEIVRDDTVYLNKAKHKCFIDVNEFGTEAAASSVLHMFKLSNVKPIKFLVNHPFLYFILVNDQQLFSGTFVNPDSVF